MNFLFIDETKNEEIDPAAFALTGLLVSADKYPSVRSGVRQAVRDAYPTDPDVIDLNFRELHFSNFLRDLETDEERYKVLQDLVNVTSANDIKIVRLGCYLTPELSEKGVSPYGICFFHMLLRLQANFKDQLAVPVMDAGFNDSFMPVVSTLSGQASSLEMLSQTLTSENISIANAKNVGEVMYVGSNYSACMQLADCVSGLRRVSETKRITGLPPKSEYKQNLLKISEDLNRSIVYEDIIHFGFSK